MIEEYKTICDKCGRKTLYKEEQRCHCSYLKTKICETCGHVETTNKMVRCSGTLRKIDNFRLDKRLTPYYERGERVEVVEKNGTKKRFWVGKTSGRIPVYLEIKKSNSLGGEVVFIPHGATIRGTGIFK